MSHSDIDAMELLGSMPDGYSITSVEGTVHVTGSGQQLVNTHPRSVCDGRACVIHHPSDHHMRKWPTLWRGDRGIMERVCPHGVGHPDPDDAAARRLLGTYERTGREVHGCDGCCQES